jgi:MFS transporter, ACS family, glucarate transporter
MRHVTTGDKTLSSSFLRLWIGMKAFGQVRWALIAWLFVLSAVSYLDRVNISIAGTSIAQAYTLDHQHLGWVFSAFVLGYMIVQAPGGRLADRFGARRTLTFAVVWWAVFSALTASVPVIRYALPVLLAIRFLLGVGEAVMFPAANRILAAWMPVAERGRASGVIFMGVGAGSFIAPLLVTPVMVHYGWRASFFVCALIGAAAGLVWYLIARDKPSEHQWVSDEERAVIHAGLPAADAAIPLTWRAIIADRTVLLLTLSYFCYGYAAYIFFTWFFIYLSTVRGMDLKASAIYAAVPFLAMAVGSGGGGVISDRLTQRYGRRVGRCGVAAVGIAIAAVCIGTGTHLTGARAASLLLALGAGTLYVAQSAFWSVSADIAGASAGAVSGLMNMGAQFGGVVTASLTPWIADHYGWPASFTVAACLCVVGAAAWLLIRPDRTIATVVTIGLAAAMTACGPAPRHFALEGASPAFWQVIPHDAALTRIATGFGFTEGPVWDTSNVLYVSDETQDSIYRVTMDGQKRGMIHLGDPDGNTFDADHRLLDGASALRAVIAVSPDGKYTVLADQYEGKRFNSPNDIVVGPDGALYFTDPTLDLPHGAAQQIPFQGVYRLDDKGGVQLLTKDLAQPNGLAFSPDGKTFYVDDSERQDIRAYDVDADGTIHRGRIFGSEPGPKRDGVPDGMRVDVSGNLYVTGPKGIWVWDSAGHHLGTIVMPEQPANLTWGDPDYGTLYITATTSVYRLRTATHGFVPYLSRSTALASPCAVTGPTQTLTVPHIATPPRLSTDPAARGWSEAAAVRMDQDCSRVTTYPTLATEIRAFWTDTDLYFLFSAPYQALNLWLPAANDHARPNLWDRDVIEVFLGADWEHIRQYREFEIAPTADWIDLAIDLDHPAEDYAWRSGWQTMARIDRGARVWYAAARIPLRSITTTPVAAGTRWRMNLYRIDGHGADPERHFLCWQPTCVVNHDPNHVPEHFGTLVFAK